MLLCAQRGSLDLERAKCDRAGELEGELQEASYGERAAGTEGRGELPFAHPENAARGGGGKRESEPVAQEQEGEAARGQTSVSQQELISRRTWMGLSRRLCQPFRSEHLLAPLGPTCP